MSGPVWSDLQEARRHSVLPVNRTMLGCLGLFHSNVFRQVQVQFLPASVRALNRACYVKKAKQIALNRSFKCDHRALLIHENKNRLTERFVAYKIPDEIDNSKAVHSGDNDYNLVVQSLRKRLVSRLDVTDFNHFDFQSNIFNFSNLQYSVSVCFRIKNINKQKEP